MLLLLLLLLLLVVVVVVVVIIESFMGASRGRCPGAHPPPFSCCPCPSLQNKLINPRPRLPPPPTQTQLNFRLLLGAIAQYPLVEQSLVVPAGTKYDTRRTSHVTRHTSHVTRHAQPG